jgi:hypothetical protein
VAPSGARRSVRRDSRGYQSRTLISAEREKIHARAANKFRNLFPAKTEQTNNVGCRAVAEPNPDYLRRRASQYAEALEVLILGHEDKAIGGCPFPDPKIRLAGEPEIKHVSRIRIQISQRLRQGDREVLVE